MSVASAVRVFNSLSENREKLVSCVSDDSRRESLSIFRRKV